MLKFELLKDFGVLIVEPRGPLRAEDFQAVSAAVDPHIRQNGKLTLLGCEAANSTASPALSQASVEGRE
jgi:hypothetical protein